jgi:hypothetical protein
LDGSLLAGRLLVGVKPLDAAGVADVAYLVAGGDRGGGEGDGDDGGGGDLDGGGELRSAPPMMPVRPYRVDAGDQVRWCVCRGRACGGKKAAERPST